MVFKGDGNSICKARLHEGVGRYERGAGVMKRLIELKVNGEFYELAAAPKQTLLEVLRDELHLTGTKEGCGMGSCCACTVLIDGKPALSCLILAVTAKGKEITTIEGLSQGEGAASSATGLS
uniref:2Fe-2S ferredoxin-type domain-containing protein n=2 Tax=Desulfobacterium TaxID=2295 RepID=E1YFI9_9BACT|nr:hypothetical protein N47_J03140 [uncultured Desulfobacterium sp.]